MQADIEKHAEERAIALYEQIDNIALHSKASFKYLVYRERKEIRITCGTQKIAEQIVKKGHELGPASFDTMEEAKAEQKRWRERLKPLSS